VACVRSALWPNQAELDDRQPRELRELRFDFQRIAGTHGERDVRRVETVERRVVAAPARPVPGLARFA